MGLKTLMIATRTFLSAALAFSVVATASAQAGARLYVAQSGHVFATYLGTTAAFTNDLFLLAPTNTLGTIFTNQTSPVGSTVDLGFFDAGTELVFGLYVRNTGNTFYSGDADRNPDGKAHALIDFGYSSTETAVYFEDLFDGPFEYNDLGFSFTNLAPTPSAPGPVSALPFALIALRRRKGAIRRSGNES